MSQQPEIRKRALKLALEQFEYCDFADYSMREIAEEVADMMVAFAQQEKGPDYGAFNFGWQAGRSSLESENAELRKLLRNLLAADGHSLTPQCSFTGCNCGGVEKYKVARSEAVGAIRGGTNHV